MNQKDQRYRRSAQIGLLTGSLLAGLGLYVLKTKPENSKAIPVFMIVYGLVRLGVSVWQIFGRKRDEETTREA